MAGGYPKKIALIGESSLLIACADALIAKKQQFEIVLIVSSDLGVQDWCQQHTILFFSSQCDFEDKIKKMDIDYLFSIVNDRYLSASVLQTIKCLSINFHDALLPAYAGVNATAWAIYHDASIHGITWHVMTDRYDAGDVLYQSKIIVDKDETTLSLNLKCYEAACHGFKSLLTQIARNALQQKPQALQNRRYYGYGKLLPNLGVINWHWAAEDIVRMIRSCFYGQYDNRFSSVKVLMGSQVYYVASAEIVHDRHAFALAGTVLQSDQSGLIVATTTQPLQLTRLLDVCGHQMQWQTLAAKHQIKVGVRLVSWPHAMPVLDVPGISLAKKNEYYWVQQFLQKEPLHLPQHLLQGEKASISFSLGSWGLNTLDALLAIIIVYFYRLSNKVHNSSLIGLVQPDLHKRIGFDLLSHVLPISLNLSGSEKLSEVIEMIAIQKASHQCHGGFLQDIFLRYPKLAYADIEHYLWPPVSVYYGDLNHMPWYQSSEMIIAIDPDTHACSVVSLLSEEELRATLARWQYMASFVRQDSMVAHYPLLTPVEYQQIVINTNQTRMPFAHNKTIVQLFEEQVVQSLSHHALYYADKIVTYGELNARANQFARYMHRRYHFAPDDLIAIALPRDENLLVVILGILKSGCAYVPIDDEMPIKPMLKLLKDCRPKVLIATESIAEQLISAQNGSDINTEIMNDTLIDRMHDQDDANLHIPMTSQQLAYVMYTSGTTGSPKGVMIAHRSLVNRLYWMQSQYLLSPDDLVLQKTPYTFDVSVWELLWALLNGAAVVLAKPHGQKDAYYIADIVQSHRITVMHFVPSMLDVFLDMPNLSLPSLRLLFCSGEQLTDQLATKCLTQLPHVALHNLYGPTEATIDVLSYHCHGNGQSVCIGKPIFNTSCYVLDAHMRPLPTNTIGELYVGGEGLARGYLNNQPLTEQCFLKNSFQLEEERRANYNGIIYKTGDLVKRLSDGTIQFIGREDHQVKIHGQRVELGAIESAMMQYPGMMKSIVVYQEGDKGQAAHGLIAYYIGNDAVDESDLIHTLRDSLPSYMIPVRFVRLKAFPITAHGKLDRKALASHVMSKKASDGFDRVAPKSDKEKQYCALWSEVLGLPTQAIGIEDDFFKIGGDSILAIRLLIKINAYYEAQLKIEDLYQFRTIKALIRHHEKSDARVLDEDVYYPFCLFDKEAYQDKYPTLEHIEDIYPASMLQAGMIVESMMNPCGTYHDIFTYTVKSRYDAQAFQFIWHALVKKHALLRSAFILSPKGYQVVVYKELSKHIEVYDHQDDDQLVMQERQKRFELARPGMFRLIVNIKSDHCFHLIYSFHHAIADGWSVASLIAEFYQCYLTKMSVMHPIKLSYGEYVRSEMSAVHNASMQHYWLEYLSTVQITKYHHDRRCAPSDGSIHKINRYLQPDTVNSIFNLSRSIHVSLDVVFIYAYFKALHIFTRERALGIGLVVNNRLGKEDGDQVFGMFLNTIPFGFSMPRKQATQDILINLFQEKVGMKQYQRYPYAAMKRQLKLKDYDFAFNYIHFHNLNDYLDDISSFISYERTNIPFTLNIIQNKEQQICVSMTMLDGFSDEKFLNEFMACFLSQLADIVTSFSTAALSQA